MSASKLITRSQAKVLGLLRYFNGNSCSKGHVAERFVSNYGCVACHYLRQPETDRRYRNNNKTKVKARKRLYYETNKQAITARNRRWVEKNRDKTRAYISKWTKAHKPYNAERRARRRFLQKQACPCWIDKKSLQLFYTNCPVGYEVDHIIPLKGKNVCGLHVPWNLQYLTRNENARKGNRLDGMERQQRAA